MKSFLLHRYRQIRRVGPRAAVRLAWDRLTRITDSRWRLAWARVRPTGLATWEKETAPRRLVPALALPWDGAHEAWLAHRFDLLGSGAKSLDLTLADPPADLPAPWHRRFRGLAAMLPAGYRLLDWQLDFKSGHRWSARQWHRAVTYGHLDGVDVKCPWEFSRLQHLPPLAGRLAAAPAAERGRIEAEIRAQVLDFVMQNPPGFGVNWVCAMDVGIRAANLVLAVDLARAAGTDYDARFLSLVSATLRDHGHFLVRNLEWGASLCSNHYLADVVGLLFVAAWLPSDEETRGWLAFAGRETVLQLRGQFHAAGTNFEASTCYHRLSAEMMAYGAALMLHLAAEHPAEVSGWWEGGTPQFHPPPAAPAVPAGRAAGGVRVPFDAADARRLRGMGWFTESLLRRDGTVPQIGDDDSGRFMRLALGADPYADLLSHAHLPAAVRALFAEPPGADETPEAAWLRRWIGPAALPAPGADELSDPAAAFLAYRDFGLYVWNRGRYRLTLRCGPVGQNGNGGHAHSDQLAITLDVDGQAVIIDPGTGVYTPDPEMRNRFRSAASHSGIVVPGREPNEWLPGRWGLFAMKDRSHARMLRCGPDGAEAEHIGYGEKICRVVRLMDHFIELDDRIPCHFQGAMTQMVFASGLAPEFKGKSCCLAHSDSHPFIVFHPPDKALLGSVLISSGYGVFSKTIALQSPALKTKISVE